MTDTKTLWDDWCLTHAIAEHGVPLFSTDDHGILATKEIGRSAKTILLRHPEMEKLIIRETNLIVEDWETKKHEYDGLIYIMFRKNGPKITPLYIGKAETFGKGDKNLSVNIKNLATDKSKFARWGDNYAYHIGDLSAVICNGHSAEKINPKYKRWATSLFEQTGDQRYRLKDQVYFWMKAWKPSDVGIWKEMSPTRLTFLEYLLIGVASSVFGATVLNFEGRNR
jgi:hypothetical protein